MNDVSINNENDFAYNISDSSGEDNNENDMDNTIKIFNDEKEVTKSKKLRSKSLLHVPLIKCFREDRNGNKTKKLSGFPFIGIFHQISLAKVRIILLTFYLKGDNNDINTNLMSNPEMSSVNKRINKIENVCFDSKHEEIKKDDYDNDHDVDSDDILKR